MSQCLACNNNDCGKMAEELVKHLSDGQVRAYCHACADHAISLGSERVGQLKVV